MKKLLFISVLFIAIMGLHAQESRFGIKGGVGFSSFNISDRVPFSTDFGTDNEDYYIEILDLRKYSQGKTNISLGLMAEFMLTDQFAIASELNYMGSGNVYEYKFNPSGYYSQEATITVSLSYLNIPVMGRYYVNDNLSLEAGPELGILLAAKTNIDATFNNNGDKATETKSGDAKDYYNSTNLSFGLGGGYKLDNGLFFNLRYNIGLSNMINKDFRNGADYIKVNAFEIGAGYFFN